MRNSIMRLFLCFGLLGLLALRPNPAHAQTADDLTKMIDRLVELDSIDLAKDVKFRAGLEPPLHEVDADESKMIVLKDPYGARGKNEPGAAGWYRVTFVVPEKLGKFAIPKGGYNLGVESNVQGAWEIYSYNNGKPAGAAMAPGASRIWSKDNIISTSNQPPTAWVSNAPLPTKAGDKITIAILATASPLGRGSPEGYALRHLRLRFALAHTSARQPFFGGVSGPQGGGTGLFGAREKLEALKGDELKALQGKLKGPLARMEAVFEAAETGKLDDLSKAMMQATKEINEALKK